MRRVKGYKPVVAPPGEDGAAPVDTEAKVVREPLLPEFEVEVGEMITKDATD